VSFADAVRSSRSSRARPFGSGLEVRCVRFDGFRVFRVFGVFEVAPDPLSRGFLIALVAVIVDDVSFLVAFASDREDSGVLVHLDGQVLIADARDVRDEVKRVGGLADVHGGAQGARFVVETREETGGESEGWKGSSRRDVLRRAEGRLEGGLARDRWGGERGGEEKMALDVAEGVHEGGEGVALRVGRGFGASLGVGLGPETRETLARARYRAVDGVAERGECADAAMAEGLSSAARLLGGAARARGGGVRGARARRRRSYQEAFSSLLVHARVHIEVRLGGEELERA